MRRVITYLILLLLICGTVSSRHVLAQSLEDSLTVLYQNAGTDSLRIENGIKLMSEVVKKNPLQVILIGESLLANLDSITTVTDSLKTQSRKYIYHTLATAYGYVGDNNRSLDALLKRLEVVQSVNDTSGIRGTLMNIGVAFQNQGMAEEAIEYYRRSLKLSEVQNNAYGMAMAHGNIGTVIGRMYPDSVIYYYTKSLEIMQDTSMRDREGAMGWMMNNIGSWYENKGETDSAFHYYYKSLEFRKSADHRLGMFLVQSDIAKLLLSTGKTDEALKHADESIRIGEENGFVDALDRSYMVRSNIREERGDFKGALQDIKRYLDLNNQTKNEEDAKTLVQQTMRYEYNLKHVTDSISYRAEIEVQEEKVNKERYARNAFMIGFLVVALFAGVILVQRNKIRKEQNRSQQLLLNILPEEVAEELKEKGAADAKHFDLVTVMFTDFKGFTQISEKLSPAELVNEIHACFKEFDQIISRYHIEKIKTIGDSYMCAGGLPVANKSHAVDVVNAALEIQKFMDGHNAERAEKGKVVFEIRIGIHTGPVVAGIVGVKKFAYDIWGDTVNIASRMESSGEAGMVNISSSTYDMVKDNFVCTSRGKIDAKNKGEIEMYFVEKKV